jgi:hypothetical protein
LRRYPSPPRARHDEEGASLRVSAKDAQDRRCNPTLNLEALVDADLDTLAIALYVRTDDLLKTAPERVPWRPVTGICPSISDAELITLAVMQALLGYVSEARWLRHARKHLASLFPYLPGQSGYNKRLRKLAATMMWLIRVLAANTSLWADDVWVIDSTRWNAAARARPRSARIWPDTPSRILRQPFALLLGAAAAPACHPARAARGVRPHRRQGR